MRRAFLAMLVLGGCAKAGSGDSIDAPGPGIDAPPEPMIDASTPDGACVPMTTQLLVNPAFDLTPAGMGWTQQPVSSSAPLVTNVGGLAAHSPSLKGLLGQVTGNNVTDVLYQDVTIPPMTTRLVITGMHAVRTNEDPGATQEFDAASASLAQPNGTPIQLIVAVSNKTPMTTWAPFTHTFTQNLSGQTVRLRFTSTSDDSRLTSFYFDSLALTATHGCP